LGNGDLIFFLSIFTRIYIYIIKKKKLEGACTHEPIIITSTNTTNTTTTTVITTVPAVLATPHCVRCAPSLR
jgi:hypothetical protein